MIDSDWVIQEARQWLGTPYRHQASVKGVGTDCLGLVRGIWRAAHGSEPGIIPPYTPDWDEIDRAESLLQAARSWLVSKPTSQPEPGDIILFRMRRDGPAKHLGVGSCSGGQDHLIHAYSGIGVVETPLTTSWRRKIVACFQIPGAGA